MTTRILTDLISRVSAATEPSRELDGEIALAFGLVPPGMERADDAWWGGGGEQWDAPRYTESIDAALTLVPKRTMWKLASWFEDGYAADLHLSNVVITRGEGATPAIALVIACLKAMEDGVATNAATASRHTGIGALGAAAI